MCHANLSSRTTCGPKCALVLAGVPVIMGPLYGDYRIDIDHDRFWPAQLRNAPMTHLPYFSKCYNGRRLGTLESDATRLDSVYADPLGVGSAFFPTRKRHECDILVDPNLEGFTPEPGKVSRPYHAHVVAWISVMRVSVALRASVWRTIALRVDPLPEHLCDSRAVLALII